MAIQAVHIEMENILARVDGDFDKLDPGMMAIWESYEKASWELKEAYREGQTGISNFPTYEELMASLKKKKKLKPIQHPNNGGTQ